MLAGALGLVLARTSYAADPTAFALVTKGNEYVGVQSKDKILHIESDKSMGTLVPTVWYVDYYDPDAVMKRVEVKFGAGQELEVSHPVRPFEMPAKDEEVFDRTRLKVDSDQALKLAAAEPLLKPLTLRAAKLTLTGSDAGPVWKVELWSAKLSDPTEEANVGTVTLSAVDGNIVRADVHPGKAN
jgi:hypothetical protein